MRSRLKKHIKMKMNDYSYKKDREIERRRAKRIKFSSKRSVE